MEIKESKVDWLVSIGQFAAWMAASAGVIIDALFIREAVLEALAWYRERSLDAFRAGGGSGPDLATGFKVTAIDMFGIFFLCLVGAAAAIWIEYYFRRGRPRGLLLKRIGIVFAVEAAIVAASVLVQAVL